MKKATVLFSILLAYSGILLAQTPLRPVNEGSKVSFVIKNFGMNTNGSLTGLNGNIAFDALHVENSHFDVTVAANSINTNNNKRDGHLRKEEYFDVAKYAAIRLASTEVRKTAVAGTFTFVGLLTIKGISKKIAFDFSATPKNGGQLFEGSFSINRRDFGVGGGSMVLSDNVAVTLSVFAR